MKRKTILAVIAACGLLAACGERQTTTTTEENQVISTQENLPGDTTLYGLACEGCTDSVIVLLPNKGGDPDTFDIIEARKAQHVFGRARTGDQLALIINGTDSTVADHVINLSRLKGHWGYTVTPRLREVAGMNHSQMPDSIRERLMKPREYGFKLKHEWAAAPIGFEQEKERRGPVEFPMLMWYNEWHIYNGHLVLTQNMETIGVKEEKRKTQHDTTDIVLLRRDSLVLQFKDHTQGYYRIDKE